jgi:uncharacterized protein (DUF305 family)
MFHATTRLARVAALSLSAFAMSAGALPVLGQESTPGAGSMADPCLVASTATPGAGTEGMDAHTGMAGMDTGTGSPMAGMDHSTMELDQMYIDMMIPHHASIVALSEAALPRLTDARLQEIAQSIVDAQSAEIEELRGYRDQFYGDPNPMAMDAAMMEAMDAMMPGMGSMDEMAFQMDPAAQVAAICGAEDVDLAFIDLVIPHHEMAITASEPVATGAANEEIQAFAERVIADQQREIDELEAIRAELTGEGAPASS